jgi:hypothetical protein
MAPFNPESKREIRERSEGKSELSGRDDLTLVCSHLDHDRKSPHYNDPENGVRTLITEELAYHMWHRYNPIEIGMTTENNDRTINSITMNLLKGGMSEDRLRDEVGQAIELWGERRMKKYYEEKKKGKYVWKDDSYIVPFL